MRRPLRLERPGVGGEDPATAPRTRGLTLRIDPVACDGIGLCAHLAPRLIGLDPWGFPIVPTVPLDPAEVGPAHRAARGCPRRALSVHGDDG